MIAGFSDGANTGFYINSYTTKQCPSMEGVLEEMRKGLDRLQAMREVEKAREQQQGDGNKKRLGRFAETMQLLKRLSASYRRCYWKSASEMLFPILYMAT